ncbi:hypothetical protein P0D73_27865 [Paraburkholderia sp. RL18-101-BIB-B]|uniref:hypothetical protein n=1 Tax=Paraburkholderia sp. RL18-101-BIB-B TaxID=3031634 RepID=UPI0038B990BC
MNPADWVDGGVLPPQRLPPGVDAALAYLEQALGHVLYRRWTLADLKRAAPSLADAKHAHPAVFALLLEHDAAIEYWAHGRLHLAAAAAAPSPDTVLARALHAHRRRFHCLPDGTANNIDETGVTAGSECDGVSPSAEAPARPAPVPRAPTWWHWPRWSQRPAAIR